MRIAAVRNESRDLVLGSRVGVADRWWLRLRGLLGRQRLAAGEGLLLAPCTSVHTFGMSYPIDVAFVDGAGRVVALYRGLPPRRVSRIHRNAVAALELPSDTLAATRTEPGDVLRVEDPAAAPAASARQPTNPAGSHVG